MRARFRYSCILVCVCAFDKPFVVAPCVSLTSDYSVLVDVAIMTISRSGRNGADRDMDNWRSPQRSANKTMTTSHIARITTCVYRIDRHRMISRWRLSLWWCGWWFACVKVIAGQSFGRDDTVESVWPWGMCVLVCGWIWCCHNVWLTGLCFWWECAGNRLG